MLDFLFQGDREAVEEYSEALDEVRVVDALQCLLPCFLYVLYFGEPGTDSD